MKDLPDFRSRGRENVTQFMTQVFVHPNQPEQSYFRRLIEYGDGHYRAIFDLSYFVAMETPTKSQWNSLKKKLKRHDKLLFVFKEHGFAPCDPSDEQSLCGYVEFGFFAHAKN